MELQHFRSFIKPPVQSKYGTEVKKLAKSAGCSTQYA